MKRLYVVMIFFCYSVSGIATADCISDCTSRYVYTCAGTIFDPIRECEENVTDPLCVARCTAEQAIGVNLPNLTPQLPDSECRGDICRGLNKIGTEAG